MKEEAMQRREMREAMNRSERAEKQRQKRENKKGRNGGGNDKFDYRVNPRAQHRKVEKNEEVETEES